MAPKRFKVVLFGDYGSGKTTMVQRFLNGDFLHKYVPTLGVDVHPISFKTTHGDVILDVWDTAGQEKFSGLRDGYYISAEAGICFYDCKRKDSYETVQKWIMDFKKVLPNAPVIVCANKVDLEGKNYFYTKQNIKEICADKITCCSMKSNYNFEKPFLFVLQALVDPSVKIV